MTNEKLYEVLGDINEKHIKEAGENRKTKRPAWLKLRSLAACFAVIMIAGLIVVPRLFDGENVIPPVSSEFVYEKGYFYHVDEGVFSDYIGGKVISEDRIGEKLTDVSVTAGWKNSIGEWLSTEKLRGEIYEINGVSDGVAVALKFLDPGEAVTATHFYVIMNPGADLSSVAEYIIAPVTPNNPGDEMAGEIPE